MKATFLIRLEPETKEAIRQIAERERRSITSLILLLIDNFLKQNKEGKNEHRGV